MTVVSVPLVIGQLEKCDDVFYLSEIQQKHLVAIRGKKLITFFRTLGWERYVHFIKAVHQIIIIQINNIGTIATMCHSPYIIIQYNSTCLLLRNRSCLCQHPQIRIPMTQAQIWLSACRCRQPCLPADRLYHPCLCAGRQMSCAM